jgi:single-strand DNA-binding protein
MMSLNRVQLIGNLGADPEVRFTARDECVANIRVATTESWKDKNGEWQEKTEWHRCFVFGPSAEVMGEKLRKGDRVFIEGQLTTRQFKDKDDIERYVTEIKIFNWIGLGSARQSDDDDRGGRRSRDERDERAPRRSREERDDRRPSRDERPSRSERPASRDRRADEAIEKIKQMKDDLPWDEDDVPY